jgi:general secretion pathway protein H
MERPAVTRTKTRAARRGVTLVELLITVGIVTLLAGTAIMGMGALQGARLKRSSVIIASAVRTAYAHANATSKTVRLAFDFEQRLVVLEESSNAMLLVRGDKTGGAADATEAEQAARAAAEAVTSGPRVARPQFAPAKALGFDPDQGAPGKELEAGVRFLQIEAAHQDDPATSDRAYLYFWPGGQTERAAIQIARAPEGEKPDDDDVLTILVSPLTGKTEIVRGPVEMRKPRTEQEESEREDSGL